MAIRFNPSRGTSNEDEAEKNIRRGNLGRPAAFFFFFFCTVCLILGETTPCIIAHSQDEKCAPRSNLRVTETSFLPRATRAGIRWVRAGDARQCMTKVPKQKIRHMQQHFLTSSICYWSDMQCGRWGSNCDCIKNFSLRVSPLGALHHSPRCHRTYTIWP